MCEREKGAKGPAAKGSSDGGGGQRRKRRRRIGGGILARERGRRCRGDVIWARGSGGAERETCVRERRGEDARERERERGDADA
jgi:hypothetical protein